MFFGICTVRIYVVFSRAKVRACLVEGMSGANESAMPVQYQCNTSAMQVQCQCNASAMLT